MPWRNKEIVFVRREEQREEQPARKTFTIKPLEVNRCGELCLTLPWTFREYNYGNSNIEDNRAK